MTEIPEKDALRLLLDSSEETIEDFLDKVGLGLITANKSVQNRLYAYGAIIRLTFKSIRALYDEHEDEIIEGLKRWTYHDEDPIK